MGDREPVSGPVALTLWIYRGDRRRVDGDNIEKAAADALNGIIWQDDQQVVDCHRYKRIDRRRPRLEVLVEGLGEEQQR
jgi:Holliday junction resolvase RusA-like endonuclease